MEFYADPSSHANSKEIEKFIANGNYYIDPNRHRHTRDEN